MPFYTNVSNYSLSTSTSSRFRLNWWSIYVRVVQVVRHSKRLWKEWLKAKQNVYPENSFAKARKKEKKKEKWRKVVSPPHIMRLFRAQIRPVQQLHIIIILRFIFKSAHIRAQYRGRKNRRRKKKKDKKRKRRHHAFMFDARRLTGLVVDFVLERQHHSDLHQTD